MGGVGRMGRVEENGWSGREWVEWKRMGGMKENGYSGGE